MSEYEITLKNCDGDELYTATMNISNKSVADITDEMIDLWQESQKTEKYTIEFTPVGGDD